MIKTIATLAIALGIAQLAGAWWRRPRCQIDKLCCPPSELIDVSKTLSSQDLLCTVGERCGRCGRCCESNNGTAICVPVVQLDQCCCPVAPPNICPIDHMCTEHSECSNNQQCCATPLGCGGHRMCREQESCGCQKRRLCCPKVVPYALHAPKCTKNSHCVSGSVCCKPSDAPSVNAEAQCIPGVLCFK